MGPSRGRCKLHAYPGECTSSNSPAGGSSFCTSEPTTASAAVEVKEERRQEQVTLSHQLSQKGFTQLTYFASQQPNACEFMLPTLCGEALQTSAFCRPRLELAAFWNNALAVSSSRRHQVHGGFAQQSGAMPSAWPYGMRNCCGGSVHKGSVFGAALAGQPSSENTFLQTNFYLLSWFTMAVSWCSS